MATWIVAGARPFRPSLPLRQGMRPGSKHGGGRMKRFVRLSPNSDGLGQDTAAPILPNLPAEGLKLAGIRAMPGEQGQMSCLVYATPGEANIALCVEKAGDPGETVPRVFGNFPSAAIHW